MNLALLFYIADVADKLQVVAAAIAFILCIGIFIMAVNAAIDGSWGKTYSVFKSTCIAAIALWVIFSILPSKSTLYTMAAAYGVQTAAENQNVQRLAGKSLQLLEDKLDEYLKSDKKVER